MSETRARRRSTASGLLSVYSSRFVCVVRITKWWTSIELNQNGWQFLPSDSRSRFLRPRANGLRRAKPPMATRGTATAAAAIPARLRPASETADWIELFISKQKQNKMNTLKCRWNMRKGDRLTGRIHRCRHLLLAERQSFESIQEPPSSCPVQRLVVQRRLLPDRQTPVWR